MALCESGQERNRDPKLPEQADSKTVAINPYAPRGKEFLSKGEKRRRKWSELEMIDSNKERNGAATYMNKNGGVTPKQ